MTRRTQPNPRTPTVNSRQRVSGRPDVELLQALLNRLQIQDNSWDLLLVGDGSGTGWLNGCGWAAALVDKLTRGRRLFFGGMNAGSVNLAEMLPYLQALTWFHATHGASRLKQCGTLLVHILTDSQVIANEGTKAANLSEELPRSRIALWAAMREFRRLGYRLTYHWTPRSSYDLNLVADLISSLCRRQVITIDGPGDDGYAAQAAAAVDAVRLVDPATGEEIRLHDINPDDPCHE